MTKVLLKSFYNMGDKGSLAPGDTADVDEAEAARLIEIGAAAELPTEEAPKADKKADKKATGEQA